MDVKGLKLGIGVTLRPWKSRVGFKQDMRPCGKPMFMNMKITCSSSIKLGGVNMGPRGDVDATVKLSDRWQDYQGSNHWDGLLDPMDDNMRREILRYGDFVDAAYVAYDFDTASPGYATCRFSKNSMMAECGLGGRGYVTTRYLHATCGIQLPRWVDRAPSWMSARSSWIGYVAVCNDKEEISRLGRRDVVIAYRGTATCLEWLENMRATLTCLEGKADPVSESNDNPMVESGFWSLYTSGTSTCNSLRDSVREEMARIMQTYGDEPLSVTIVGHSLGAALATLTAYDVTSNIATNYDSPPPLVTVFSFGGPRIGNKSFRSELSKSGAKVLRIVNTDDFITKVPGFVIDNNDMAPSTVHLSGSGLPQWLQKRVEDTRWVYADVGRELRLSSKKSPYLSNPDIATCHNLKTYLHLVDGFVSSSCPFRATAERLMAKS